MTGCWLWTGSDDGGAGYGRFSISGRSRQAHRVAYEIFKGPIPDGLTLDHKCRTPGCVNPDHLAPVTAIENLLRGNYRKGLALGGAANGKRQSAKTHCPYGHPYDSSNTYTYLTKSGGTARRCRACRRSGGRARALRAEQGGL